MAGNRQNKSKRLCQTPKSLHALTAAALVLPGLIIPNAYAAEDDGVDFQYSHYQEGKRDIYGAVTIIEPAKISFATTKLPQNLNPIEVDSIHGSSRITLSDRIKFAFNYTQDTWSGATPIGTAPVVAIVNIPKFAQDNKTITGASPFAQPSNGNSYFIDKKLNFLTRTINRKNGRMSFAPDNRLTHVLSSASPETRKQGDFKLSYGWNEAALDVGAAFPLKMTMNPALSI